VKVNVCTAVTLLGRLDPRANDKRVFAAISRPAVRRPHWWRGRGV